MLKLLYYLFGILFAYHKNKDFKNISKRIQNSLDTKEKKVIKVNPKNINQMSDEEKELLKSSLVAFLFFIWMLIGLFTFQWILFAGVLLIGTFINWIITKFFSQNLNVRIVLSKAYIIITWLLCIGVSVNAYYFNINSNEIINFVTAYGRK